MQDGAPPHSHYATAVLHFLNDELPGRWFGLRGPVEWPARLCDKPHNDIFFAGRLKCIHAPLQSLNNLKHAIRDALTNVPAELLRKAMLKEEVTDRLRKLTERN